MAEGPGRPGGQARRRRRELTSDADFLREAAAALAAGIESAIPAWVARSVHTIAAAYQGEAFASTLAVDVVAAGARAGREIGAQIRQLLETDIDDQATTPLSILRGAVRYPTAVLEAGGVPAAERDAFSSSRFPADIYDLSPASLAEVDPSLTDLGIAWGAAKARVHVTRHGSV